MNPSEAKPPDNSGPILNKNIRKITKDAFILLTNKINNWTFLQQYYMLINQSY